MNDDNGNNTELGAANVIVSTNFIDCQKMKTKFNTNTIFFP